MTFHLWKKHVLTILMCFSGTLSFAQEGIWTTTVDRTKLLEYSAVTTAKLPVDSDVEISIDLQTKYQTVVGFGGTLTDGSVKTIQGLGDRRKSELLDELFLRPPQGLGISVLRISVGASDLSERPYTYADSPVADPNLKSFDLSAAQQSLMPMLQEIKRRNPKVKLMATPWSAPEWMKDNRAFVGGSLATQHYATYAKYLVKYLQSFDQAGLPLDYLTVQNEPENPHNNPSMLMSAEQQAKFIGEFLGPAMRKAKISTKILAYDHNCDHPEYPIAVLNDSKANPFVSGSAFHLYAGKINALDQVHQRFPNKELHFTEQWVSAEGDFAGDLMWHSENVLIGSLRNHAMSVLEWNISSDEHHRPHTQGGCDKCLGALTIGADIQRNVAYYIIAHGSKFIPQDSYRVASKSNIDVPHVAFVTPDSRIALLLVNVTQHQQQVVIKCSSQQFVGQVPPQSLSTFVSPALDL